MQIILLTYLLLFINFVCLNSKEIKVLLPLKSIQLSESEYVITKKISSASISPNGQLIALIDANWSDVEIFDANNGFLVGNYKANSLLSETFYKYRDRLKYNNFVSYNSEIVSTDTAIARGWDISHLVNTFHTVKFLNNKEILVGITLRGFSVTPTKEKHHAIENIGGYALFNEKLEMKECVPFYTTGTEYPMLGIVYPYVNNSYIYVVENCEYYNMSKIDSLFAFSLYTKDGNYIKNICVIPQDYIDNGFVYKPFREQKICNVDTSYFWTTVADYKIRNLFTSESFPIQGFDSTNLQDWISYRNAIVDTNNKSKRIALDINLPIINLEGWKDSLIAVFIKNSRNHVQFYSKDGKLVEHFILLPPDGMNIVYIIFAARQNKIVAITRNDDNYYCTDYIIE